MILAYTTSLYAQTPGTGTWTPGNSSTTNNDLGIGTSTPRGKQEIIYCPSKDPQDGLIITAKDCSPGVINPNTNYVGGQTVVGDWSLATEGGGSGTVTPPVVNIAPYVQVVPSSLSSAIAKHNLFWIREEESVNLNTTNYDFRTQFIVNSEGRTGINTMNPRAQLDVVQYFAGINNNLPTAIFSKRQSNAGNPFTLSNGISVTAHKTSQIMFFNRLGALAYNSIIQQGDQAIIYSDGGNADGSNVSGTFAIAPWGTSGGLRMEANGNTELRGNLRCTKVVVNAQWWPDFVFHCNYKLMPLSQVKTFITNNSHLPGMPSQDSVMHSGQDVGELQKLQQQKIEELTLYTIQQDEQLKAQEAALQEQKAKLEALEAKLNVILKK
jgi:hypothetical protein